MIYRLEMLAVCRKLSSRIVRAAKASASALTVALISFFLTGCSAVSDLTKKDWGDLLITVGKLLGILPDSVEAKTPLEFVIDKWGENFGQGVEEGVIKITQIPPLDQGFLGTLNEAVTWLGFTLAVIFVSVYLLRLRSFRKKFGSVAVNEGYTALIPPKVYFPKRFLPVFAVIVGGLAVLMFSLRKTHQLVNSFANVFYAERGETIGSLSFILLKRLLDGADIWVLGFLVLFVVPAFLFFMMFLLVRVGLIELRYLRMMIQLPAYLSGTSYKHLSEPLHYLFKRVVVLGTTWLVVLLGLIIIEFIGVQGFPVAMGMFATFVMAIATPWILFGFWFIPSLALWAKPFKRSAEWLENKSAGWFDDFDVYPVDPNVFPEEWNRPGVARRTWERVPQGVRSGLGFAATTAVGVAERHPEYGPTITAARNMSARTAASREDPKAVAQEIATQMYGDDVYQSPSSAATSPTSRSVPSAPPVVREGITDTMGSNIDELARKSRAAGLHKTKNKYKDEQLAVVAELVAQGFAGTSVDERKAAARKLWKDMNRNERKYWERRSEMLRRRL